MITSLALENWKSHSSSHFSFRRGTNILLGRMGSGKSSVLDALCFALYGTFPKMSRRDQAVENIASIGSGAQHATVRLGFEKGGKKYEVERRIGRKISEAEVRLDGKLVQKGPKPVTDYVTTVLGVDYELFTRAIYSEQNRIDYLLSLNPKSRKQEIDWLLGLGEFDTAREGAQAAAAKLAEQAEIFLAEAPPDKIAQVEKRALELSLQQEQKKAAVEKLRLSAGELASRLRLSAEEVAKLEKSRSAHREAQSEFQRLSGAADRLGRDCEGKQKPGMERLKELAEGKKRAEAELAGRREAARKLQDALSGAKSSLAVAQSRLKAAQESQERRAGLSEKLLALTGGKMVETLEKELAEERSEFENMVQLHAALHAQEEELRKSIDALSGAGARCPVCDSDLSGGRAEKVAELKRAQIEDGRKLASGHVQEIAAKKERLGLLEKSLVEAKSCQSELQRLTGADEPSELQKKVAGLRDAEEKSESALSSAEKELPGLEAGLDRARLALEEAERLERLFLDFGEAQLKLSSAKQKLAEISFDEHGYEKARALSENLRVEHARASSDLSGEEKQLALVGQMALEEGKTLEGMRQKQHLSKQYTEAAQSLTVFKNGLISAQSELRSALVEEINQALGEIWPAVYPYTDYGGVKIEADGKDYRLLMERQGWMEVDSVASGGERACLCLALRIAFATVLTPDVSWLILDEPTHNLDAEAVLALSEAINSKIPSIVEQTFVITHDISLGETGEGAIFRLERDKAKNEPTRVSQG
jgi:DNA repair protein SbcC/Rad50